MAPKDGSELIRMLKTAVSHNGPVVVRYPRGTASRISDVTDTGKIPICESEVLRSGNDILIIALGSTVTPALQASQILEEMGTDACVVNARFVKPIDTGLIGSLAKEIKYVLTVEENVISGGFGSSVLEHLSELNIPGLKIKRLGLPDEFIEH